MRKYDVAYVPNGPANYYPAKDLSEMTLEEIVAKHIKTCGKANGNLAVCSQCKSPCREGKRAIQLLSNKVYNDPPIPLYGGKTLIEKAREENLKRKENASNISILADALAEAHKEEHPKKKKRGSYLAWDGWYEEATKTGDPVKWVMDNMKLSKTQAKKKVYMYEYHHGLRQVKEEPKKETVEPVSKETKVESKENKTESKAVDAGIETKIEHLMKLQEEQKKAMAEYQKLYEEAKKEYERLKAQADVLCEALDILNS